MYTITKRRIQKVIQENCVRCAQATSKWGRARIIETRQDKNSSTTTKPKKVSDFFWSTPLIDLKTAQQQQQLPVAHATTAGSGRRVIHFFSARMNSRARVLFSPRRSFQKALAAILCVCVRPHFQVSFVCRACFCVVDDDDDDKTVAQID